MIVYFNGSYLDKANVRISPDDRGFLFADGVYDVVRSYNGKPFRLDAHLARIRRNLAELRITLPGLDTPEQIDSHLRQITGELLTRNQINGGGKVYYQITRGVAPRKHAFPTADIAPTVYIAADPFEIDPEQVKRGVRIHLVPDTRWARCDIKTINLLPNVLAQQAAVEAGAHEAVFVRGDRINEGSHTSVVAIMNGEVVTTPGGPHNLPSVTRSILFDLTESLGIRMREQAMTVEEFCGADEALLLGTTTELTPIRGIVGHECSFAASGPLTQRLQDAFYRLVDRECS